MAGQAGFVHHIYERLSYFGAGAFSVVFVSCPYAANFVWRRYRQPVVVLDSVIALRQLARMLRGPFSRVHPTQGPMSKSDTCTGKKTGKPLTEYVSLEDAEAGAEHANATYKRNLVPYHCEVCGKWHLSPKERQTPSTKCPFCKGANGQAKDAYRSQKEARRRADILKKEQGVALKVYACEHSDTWHLTRDQRPDGLT